MERREEEEEERKNTEEEEEERKNTEEEEEERKNTEEEEEERKNTDQEEEERKNTEEEEEERKNTEEEEEEEERKNTEEEEEGSAEESGGDDDDDDDEDDEAEEESAEKKTSQQKGVGVTTFADRKCVPGTSCADRKCVPGTSCADRKCVPGIIYLGHIPPRLRPKHLRNLLTPFGEIGRIFLQPEDGQVRRRKRRSGLRRCDFTEGWVEFRDKRVAKKVAASLHNTPMGTRKRQRFCSDLWSIKYLHRFQWTHLSERLSYEQTVQQQRLRTEVSQAKRETNFYLNNVEKSAHLEQVRRKRRRDGAQVEDRTWDFTQRQTEDEIQVKKKKDSVSQKHLDKTRLIQQKSQSNVSLLAKIFNNQ